MALLRILHVTPYYEGAWAYGGIPRAAAALCTALARRGHEVTVATTDVCDARTRLNLSAPGTTGSPVHVETFPNRSNRLAYHLQVFTPVGLGYYLQREVPHFDVVHVHGHRHALEIQASAACARLGVPLVLTPNGTAPRIERRQFAKLLFDAAIGHRLLSRATVITAVSHAERRQLIALGILQRQIRMLPNSVDLFEFPERPGAARPARGAPIVMFLGKLTPRKGVDVLVRAFASLPFDAHLEIAGNDMGSESSIRTLVRRLRLDSRVSWAGLLRGSDRLAALANADVVVYPSRDEVFGIVALEALLCGTPVIVSDDSGCGEVVRRLGGGLTVPYGDVPQLARSIQRVLAARGQWRDRAAVAAERVRAEFSADHVVLAAERIYRDACLSATGAAA